eukprot:3529304-Pyramimonas_sp.AAC.1
MVEPNRRRSPFPLNRHPRLNNNPRRFRWQGRLCPNSFSTCGLATALLEGYHARLDCEHATMVSGHVRKGVISPRVAPL